MPYNPLNTRWRPPKPKSLNVWQAFKYLDRAGKRENLCCWNLLSLLTHRGDKTFKSAICMRGDLQDLFLQFNFWFKVFFRKSQKSEIKVSKKSLSVRPRHFLDPDFNLRLFQKSDFLFNIFYLFLWKCLENNIIFVINLRLKSEFWFITQNKKITFGQI